MKRTMMLAALTFATTFGSLAAAQVPGGKANYFPTAPKAQVAPDRRDDRWDLRQLQALQDRFVQAQKKRWVNRNEIANLDAELKRYLAAELRETRVEVVEANAELKDARHPKNHRADVVEARAEQREERKSLKELQKIDASLKRLYGRYDVRSVTARGQLIDQLVVLAKAESRDARMIRR